MEYKGIQSAIIVVFTSSVLGYLQIGLERTLQFNETLSVFIRSESESFSHKRENSSLLLGNNHSPPLIRNLKRGNSF